MGSCFLFFFLYFFLTLSWVWFQSCQWLLPHLINDSRLDNPFAREIERKGKQKFYVWGTEVFLRTNENPSPGMPLSWAGKRRQGVGRGERKRERAWKGYLKGRGGGQ